MFRCARRGVRAKPTAIRSRRPRTSSRTRLSGMRMRAAAPRAGPGGMGRSAPAGARASEGDAVTPNPRRAAASTDRPVRAPPASRVVGVPRLSRGAGTQRLRYQYDTGCGTRPDGRTVGKSKWKPRKPLRSSALSLTWRAALVPNVRGRRRQRDPHRCAAAFHVQGNYRKVCFW